MSVHSRRHRSNPEYASVDDYFKKTVTIPFLDQLISDISSRITKHSKQAASLQNLVPINISGIQDAVKFYSNDSMLLDEEFCRWKTKWINVPPEDRPQTLSTSMQHCSKHSLPNIFNLLQLFATLPLSSCTCEKSASALRRLNNYI